jgi:WD40 repeat protein
VLDGRAIALTSLNPSSASSTVSLIDVTTPSDPQQLCTYPVFRWQARFVSASVLGYAAYLANSNPSDGEIGTFDILRASSRTVVRWQNGGFGAGTFAWSPDGSLAYIRATAGTDALSGAGSWELRLLQQGQDRILTTLPGVGGRGIGENDDTFLAFSPDGKYLALETTFTGPSQVRAAADGSLVKAFPQGITMAVWAGNSLFYGDQAGVYRWDPAGTTSLILPGVHWIRPRASSDGRWIAYSVRDSTGLHHVSVFNVAAGTTFTVPSGGRVDAVFLTPTVLWDSEERLCTANDACGMSQTLPTGMRFIYDLATRLESRSVIAAVGAVWPRMD